MVPRAPTISGIVAVLSVLWTTLALLLVPNVSAEELCPSGCSCFSTGFVKCTGHTITDIPVGLPVSTNLLLMSQTKMNVINEQSLANLDKLLRFSLSHSHLHSIHPKAFQIAPQLKSVKLSFNDLYTIPAGVFLPLSTLEQLHIDGNKLANMSPDMLAGLIGLWDLDLKKNKLSNLPSNIFDGLTNLTCLNLGRNSLKTLPPNIFNALVQLRNLNNKLEELLPHIFANLTSLRTLLLQDNNLKDLPQDIFHGLSSLSEIDLSNNALKTISGDSFTSNAANVSLSGNPWNCTCNIRGLYLFSFKPQKAHPPDKIIEVVTSVGWQPLKGRRLLKHA
uniref:Si:ch211-117l17.7 n=1 Tax=Neogobius melanostomus TaxID=47308 RepID=A0A8C6WSY9_9GOBI